jgi:hypothetical protein
MRKLIAVVASAAALLIAGMANAASVTVTQQGQGSSIWEVSMSSATAVGQVAFIVTSTPVADFTITAPATSVDPFVTGFSVKNIDSTAGTIQVILAIGNPGPIASGVLGNLTVTGAFTFAPDTGSGGLLLETDQATEIPADIIVVPSNPVPEPGMVLLLGAGLAGLALARRSA